MIHLLLDGDWIIYAAGFAGQKTEYVGLSAGGYDVAANQTELAMKIFEDENAKPKQLVEEGVHVYSRIIVDPPAHVFHSAKNMIETQVRETQKKFPGEDVQLTVYVDGDGNFRSRLATIRPYKGNRSESGKPVMFNDIRSYLLDVWEAEVVFGQESDDQMAIDATELQAEGEKVVICGVDKDMLQVPAFHRNPNKGWKRINREQGLLNLYRQCLTGDQVDNIQGCYKCGPKAALCILPKFMEEDKMWLEVLGAYTASVDKYGTDPYRGLSAEAAAVENMRLVYLRRKDDELWLPPQER